MNKAISIELQFFLISILWGAILLLVYDGLRIIRRVFKHNGFFIAVEDLIFWVMSSLFIFIMMYKENNGIIRGFSIMGMTIGMVLYHYILSELLVNLITKLIYTLFRPFILAFNQVKRLFMFFYSKVKKLTAFFLLRLKKLLKSVKITIDHTKKRHRLKREIHKKKKAEKKEAQALKKQLEKDKREKQIKQIKPGLSQTTSKAVRQKDQPVENNKKKSVQAGKRKANS
jgi:spore cortex biosynthesis protein YabQ